MNIKLAKPESFFAEFNEGGSIIISKIKCCCLYNLHSVIQFFIYLASFVVLFFFNFFLLFIS